MLFDVFISYSQKDRVYAEQVCTSLEAANVRCWIAPRNIKPGADWAESIIAALGSCRAMVVIFSSSANTSPQVTREVQRAFEKGLTVMPFRIEDVQPSAALEYYMGSVHWLDALTEPMERHIEKLVSLVKAFIEAASQTEQMAQSDAIVPDSDAHSPVAHFSKAQTVPEEERAWEEARDCADPSHRFSSVDDVVPRMKVAPKQVKRVLIFVVTLFIIGGAVASWWVGIEKPKREAEREQEF